ncbi:MAG: hypothetical protein AB7O91_04170 [Sphingomonas sp.]
MRLIIFAALALSACATAPVREIETRDVVVTRTERPITEQQVRDAPPPAPLPSRPTDARAALELALAQVCSWVAWGLRVDPLLQHSAGMPIAGRIAEPACQRD